MTFQQKLDRQMEKTNSLVCVGLDSDHERLPAHLTGRNAMFRFNKAIIDATHDLVCAYKPNSAFYEEEGEEGIEQLKMTADYLVDTYPDIPLILDAKRADIGTTNKGYAAFAFDHLGMDAITLHPYLGREALMPFLDRKDKGCIVLCRTSNKGAGEFQDLKIGRDTLYKRVAIRIRDVWNKNGNCMLVVGATYPRELSELRRLIPEMTFLVPGVGAQGGDVQATVEAGLDKAKKGIIISSSRGIIFASSGKDFAEAARRETRKLLTEINKYR